MIDNRPKAFIELTIASNIISIDQPSAKLVPGMWLPVLVAPWLPWLIAIPLPCHDDILARKQSDDAEPMHIHTYNGQEFTTRSQILALRPQVCQLLECTCHPHVLVPTMRNKACQAAHDPKLNTRLT